MIRIAYMTGQPEDEAEYTFASTDAYEEWSFSVGDIKSRIYHINNDGRAGAPRVPHYRRWLAIVNTFVVLWGVDRVPNDIRRAVNDVEGNLGLSLTVWDDRRD